MFRKTLIAAALVKALTITGFALAQGMGYPQPSPVFPNQSSVRSPFAPPGADGVLAVGQAQPAPAFQHE